MARPEKSITGLRVGRLLVLHRIDMPKTGVFYKCRCDCGKFAVVKKGYLISGCTSSCGCYRKELAAEKGFKPTHGRAKKRVSLAYRSWGSMRGRCLNSRAKAYRYYGGRGIKICEQWEDFAVFLADMGERPSRAYELDRIDPNGHYEPSNCRWWLKGKGKKRSYKRNKPNTNSAKLTATDVARIRRIYRPSHPRYSATMLSQQYGVSIATISLVVNHKTWASI